MKNVLARDADKEVTGGFTKLLLKRKYMLLFKIVFRVILESLSVLFRSPRKR